MLPLTPTKQPARAGAAARNDAHRVAVTRAALRRRDADSRQDASRARVRVIIAEPELITREWLVAVLAASPEVEIVAVCPTLTELKAQIEACDPDVVVTDLRAQSPATSDAVAFVAALRHRDPPVGVVVLSHDCHPDEVAAFLDGGSAWRAYLEKRRIHTKQDLIKAITRVASGDTVIDPTVCDELVQAQAAAEQSPLVRLTPREREVLAEVAAGKSNGSIAQKLVLSSRAVEKHVGAIFFKLDLRDTEDASRRVTAALIYLAASQTS